MGIFHILHLQRRLWILARAFMVSLRRRPPFLGRLPERGWVIVVGVVMGSVHKLGYGHKFEGSAATSVVA
jgi:hypothetical protein